MRIFPAIDIRNRQCVRLRQGNYNEQTTYGDPIEMAKRWVEQGANYLHLVDLDAAKGDPSNNLSIIQSIIREVPVPVQVGGGIRSLERVTQLLDLGVERVILGTAAVKNPELVKQAVEMYGEAIVVSIDARDGLVATDGWLETSEVQAIDFAKRLDSVGVKTIVYTDISRDGMLEGPNIEALNEMNHQTHLQVIASGGMSSMEDVRKLSDSEIYGAIIGKALYEETINLVDVMKEPTTC
ncbi:1-(5-phosphoribosyl)-5-[(5-phosphoribosylamino)methylideneamino]imidazole-4-carboxamide isomerase [Alkalibacillus aidingensis]|uniref:1-(5-phosphoribosyl)-5-[(5- phosphoribosylamino)methylideneamino]imidazole-4- carboxamide isomerase n=1 Tax=Alkalibacillus aidingensis TaxID=2747607 RepID=UPI001660D322|nr:1-(5-phosphoribosyl)-5-[(5-phosphoribosylamino)methylideneamino]imidazole-4-carboxamide isomerase [Alkalibacillus aidingensis]